MVKQQKNIISNNEPKINACGCPNFWCHRQMVSEELPNPRAWGSLEHSEGLRPAPHRPVWSWWRRVSPAPLRRPEDPFVHGPAYASRSPFFIFTFCMWCLHGNVRLAKQRNIWMIPYVLFEPVFVLRILIHWSRDVKRIGTNVFSSISQTEGTPFPKHVLVCIPPSMLEGRFVSVERSLILPVPWDVAPAEAAHSRGPAGSGRGGCAWTSWAVGAGWWHSHGLLPTDRVWGLVHHALQRALLQPARAPHGAAWPGRSLVQTRTLQARLGPFEKLKANISVHSFGFHGFPRKPYSCPVVERPG